MKQIQQLQAQANSTLLEFESLDIIAENVSDSVEEAEELPSQASNLTDQAREVVNELQEKLFSTTPPDTDTVDNIQAYIDTVAGQLDSNNIEEITTALEANRTTLSNMLSDLQEEYQQIEQEVQELRALADMLPPDCDSNY